MSLGWIVFYEVFAAAALAGGAMVMWYVITPLTGVVGPIVRASGPYAELAVFALITITYYVPLHLTFLLLRRTPVEPNAIRLSYFGGWWVIVMTALGSVYHPVFLGVFGLPMDRGGVNLIVISLVCGAIAQWRWTLNESRKEVRAGSTGAASGSNTQEAGHPRA